MTYVIDVSVKRVLARTVELTQIPAPSGHEEQRAAVVKSWWEADGILDVQIDEVGNVWGRVAGPPDAPAFVACAHLDTVFAADEDHSVVERDGRLFGRSVGDNSVAVAAVSELPAFKLEPPEGTSLWLLATVCEEGLGNLRGARHAVDHSPVEIAAFIAVEGNILGSVGITGVASTRLKATFEGPGGHAWEHRSNPSAVHAAIQVAAKSIASAEAHPGCSLNIGMVEGGDSITARARAASIMIDMRSAQPAVLAELVTEVEGHIAASVGDGITVDVADLGRRPGGSIDPDHALVRAACDALVERGIDAQHKSLSTDANAAYPLDIPAISVGITYGDMHHSPDEWIDVAPVADGLGVLARTFECYWASPT